MRLTIARTATIVAVLSLGSLYAQQPEEPATTVPRLVRLNGSFHPANGLSVGPTESATLSIYRDEQGGTPLWQETQNVSLDANGQYTAMLGITQKDGVPADLFSATEPRWLGVQFNRPWGGGATASAIGEYALCAEGRGCGDAGRQARFGITCWTLMPWPLAQGTTAVAR